MDNRYKVDSKVLEQDLAGLERKSAVDVFYHRLKLGDNIFRLIPDVNGNWYALEPQHFIYDNISTNRPVPCHYYKSDRQEKCPVCAAYFELDEEERQNSRMKIVNTHMLRVIDMQGQVGILNVTSVKLYRKLLQLVKQSLDDYQLNILQAGAFINIVKVKTGEQRHQVEYDVKVVQKPTKMNGQVAMLTQSEPLSEEVLAEADKLPAFNEIYPAYTVEEIEKMLNGEILERFNKKDSAKSEKTSLSKKPVERKPSAPAPKMTKAAPKPAMPAKEEPVSEDADVEEYMRILTEE